MRAFEFLTETDFKYDGQPTTRPDIGFSYGGWIDNKNNIYKIFGQEGHVDFIKDVFGSEVDYRDIINQGWVRTVWTNNSLNIQGHMDDMKRVLRFMITRKLLHSIKDVMIEPIGAANDFKYFDLIQNRTKFIQFVNGEVNES